jgi:hypothetical protein
VAGGRWPGAGWPNWPPGSPCPGSWGPDDMGVRSLSGDLASPSPLITSTECCPARIGRHRTVTSHHTAAPGRHAFPASRAVPVCYMVYPRFGRSQRSAAPTSTPLRAA